MTRIVLHLGPEKCGSSAIQNALRSDHGGLRDIAHMVMPDPEALLALDCDDPNETAVSTIRELLASAVAEHRAETLIVSQEMLFKSVEMQVNLALIAKEFADEVTAIAYVRRQSDFLVSSFGQWLFRSPERLTETANVLMSKSIDPSLFWGVERHLIAAIQDDWSIGRQLSGHLYLDWSASVPERVSALADVGVRLSIGALPRPGFEIALIPDFLTRAGLASDALDGREVERNPAFPAGLIEAVVNAIEEGYDMPTPHQANDFFEAETQKPDPFDNPNPQFLQLLKSHIDTEFDNRNSQFADTFKLPPTYFAPATRVGVATIEEAISTEAADRSHVPADTRRIERRERANYALAVWSDFLQR